MTLQKITVNVPHDILENAMGITGKGVTQTIIEGLKELERKQKLQALRRLRGRVHVSIDLDRTRR
jgi:hypothetical protein